MSGLDPQACKRGLEEEGPGTGGWKGVGLPHTAELFPSGEEGHLRAPAMDGGQTPKPLQL